MKRWSEADIDNLAAIVDHCERVRETYERIEKSYETFLSDADFRDSLLMNIIQIGEAANRLSDECREELSELPWREVIGTRNVVVHGYRQIDDDIVWDVIIKDIPRLEARVKVEIEG